MELNKLGVWYFLDGMPSNMAAETAKRIESLATIHFGYPKQLGATLMRPPRGYWQIPKS